MKKITIELAQHTPMLHFDRTPGATLRATEVKPKLDRFLIKNLFRDPNVYSGFLIPETNALDYKMRIKSSTGAIGTWEKKPPMYFGDIDPQKENPKYKSMGMDSERHREYIKKMDEYKENLKEWEKTKEGEKPVPPFPEPTTIELLITCKDLSSWLDNHTAEFRQCLSAFFFETNFGTRQTKGYGCFFPVKINGIPTNFDSFMSWYKLIHGSKHKVFHFPLIADANKHDIINNIMEKVQWFYQSLRQGINRHDRGLYIKPMIFLYAKSKGIQWEKKAIKDKFYNNANISDNAKAIKPVLGLSSNETWKLTDNNEENKIFNTVELGNEGFDRVPSPLTFKVFQRTLKDYDVYIILNEELMSRMRTDILGKPLSIEVSKLEEINNKKTKRNVGIMELPIIEKFDWQDFLIFVRGRTIVIEEFEKKKKERKQKKEYQKSLEENIYDTLNNIYSTIRMI